MTKSRVETIKNARSLNDVLDVIKDIAYEVKNRTAIVARLVSSLSAEIIHDVRQKKQTTRTGTPPEQEAKVVRDAKFVAPKLADLKKHVDVINNLYENVLELDAAEAMVKQSFAGHKKQASALKAIKDLKTDIDASINDAFDALSEVARKHLPTRFNSLVDKVTSHIIDVVPAKKYKDISRQVYVIPDPKDSAIFHFCDYILLTGLQNLDGFTYDQYYIVVTGLINKAGSIQYFVNGLPDFKLPGRYPLGKEVKDATAAQKHVDLLLDHNNFVIEQEKQPLPIDNDRAQTSGLTSLKGVESVRVDNDELVVFFEPNVQTQRVADKITVEILGRLNGIVGARKNDKLFQYKYIQRSGKKAVKFILVPNIGRKMNFSLQHLAEVSELLGLSDKQQAALRFALQH